MNKNNDKKPKIENQRALAKRNEIIQRAYDLFYRQGFHATGVDTVLADSGISKRTLYKYFRTKEELIAAVVDHYQTISFDKIPKLMATRHTDPLQQILCLFDIKGEEFANGNFTGCFALNAKLEFESKDDVIEKACSGFYVLLEAFVAGLCASGHCKNPQLSARQIIILFKGAIVLGQMHHDASTVTVAKSMARTILESDM